MATHQKIKTKCPSCGVEVESWDDLVAQAMSNHQKTCSRPRMMKARLSPEIDALLKKSGSQNVELFVYGPCRILRSMDGGRLHLSMSCADRYPTWDEIKEIRYTLAPQNVTMVMFLPPPEEFVNVHDFTFHLFETPEVADIENYLIQSLEPKTAPKVQAPAGTV